MRFFLAIAAIGASVAVGWGVYTFSTKAVAKSIPEVRKQPVAVEVMVSAKRTIEDRAKLVGSLTAGAEVQVLSHRNGYLRKLPFDVGDRIEAGDVIAELDSREQQELLAGANAALVVAEAQTKAARAQEELARTAYERQKRLANRSAATQQDLEQAEAQWNIAVAQRELEEARVSKARSDVNQAMLLVEDSKILAPISGFVGERYVDVGDLAKPDVPLLRLVSFDTLRTVVHVVEKDYPRVKTGQDATIHVDAFPQQAFFGKVIRKAPVLNPNTRTAAVQIEIPNPKGLLKPGMHARVSLVFTERQTFVLPVAAVMSLHQSPTVFVIENDPATVREQRVEVGISDGEYVEILDGIEPGEQVVTLGSRLVKNGQAVKPVEVPWSLQEELEIIADVKDDAASFTTGD